MLVCPAWPILAGMLFAAPAPAPVPLAGAPPPTHAVTPAPPPLPQRAAPVEKRAARAGSTIHLDGFLNDPPWEDAPRLTGFVQQVPRPGAPISEPTEVRILYDDENLYLGVICGDREPGRILARTLARDDFSLLADDLFAVAIDSAHTGRDGFWFATNPLGAQFDAQIFNEGRIFDTAWDGVWEARSRIEAEGWTAEMRIPLFNLRFTGAPVVTLGFNFRRLIRRRNEEAYLPPIPRDYGDEKALSRALPVGLEEVQGGPSLQILPHGLVKHRRSAEPGADTDDLGRTGLDVKWGITPGLSADFTLNTDFAETEVDQQQINLTRFALFFPEKREFFLENAGLFDFGLPAEVQIFFSRRIGLQDGKTVPLRVGGRLSGRLGRTTIGVLDALTDGTPEAPGTNFGVLRARQDLGARASAGLLLTDRSSDAGGNRVVGADLFVPFRNEYRLQGFIAGSSTTGPGGDGGAGWFRVAREGDVWQYSADYTEVDSDFVAGTGFVQRANQRRRRGSIAWRPRPHGSAVRQWTLLYSPTYLTDDDNRLMTRLHFTEISAEFHTGDRLGMFYLDDFERLPTPFDIFPQVTIPPGEYHNSEAQVIATTSSNRPWAGSVLANLGDFFGGRRRILGASLIARDGRHLAIGTEFTHNRMRLPAGDFSTRLAALRVRYAFTTRLFGGLLVQSNSLTDEVGVNLRLNWVYRPGSDFFAVYNRLLRRPDAPFLADAEEATSILKLTCLWRF
jgi:hypothetical protein